MQLWFVEKPLAKTMGVLIIWRGMLAYYIYFMKALTGSSDASHCIKLMILDKAVCLYALFWPAIHSLKNNVDNQPLKC